MAIVLPPRLAPVNCAQLQFGMYVAELDRSWLQTSFHAHGFLISQSEQSEELRRLCSYVYVDPVLSEYRDSEMFYTGLTAEVEALSACHPPTALAWQRMELRAGFLYRRALGSAVLMILAKTTPLSTHEQGFVERHVRRLPAGPVLWQPIRQGDIVRVLESGTIRIPQRQLDEALGAAANLAA